MNILIACEESQAVCKEMRNLGHNAFSCDIVECSGGHPEWHIKNDCVPLLNGYCTFITMDGMTHAINSKWDMIIAHPPCTDLAISGAKYFKKKREDGRQRKSIEFFCKFLEADCDRVAIENPVGIISGSYIKEHFPDLSNKYNLPIKFTQAIQPYEYGHKVRKKTCLWLKNLPDLIPTDIVEPEIIDSSGKTGGYSGAQWHAIDERGKVIAWNDKRTAIQRSKTFKGIAEAMANQWAGINT